MRLFQILVTILFLSMSCKSQTKPGIPAKINIKLPSEYILEKNLNDKYNLLTASKYAYNEIVALIEIKYSNDPSLIYLKNQDIINEMLKTDKVDTYSDILFNDFKIHSKEESYLKGIGKCVSFIYSGTLKENGIRITNVSFQFLKNNCIYTLVGSSTSASFSSNYKEFIVIFDTVTL